MSIDLDLSGNKMELGGTGQQPQVVLNRWGGERAMLLSLDTTEKAAISLSGEKYLLNGSIVKLLWYAKGTDFEYELVFNTKPLTNILDLKLETAGLLFYPQPALTPEEVAAGHIRADDVVGGLAVYHDSKRGLHGSVTESNKYRTGGWGFIFRPKITGFDGKWAWCQQEVSLGQLRIIIPIDFSGKLPWTLDPTFGLTDESGYSTVNLGADSARRNATTYSPASNGTLDSMSFFGRDGGDSAKMAIYNAADDSLVDSTAGGNTPAAFSWITQAANGVNIFSANSYKFAVKVNAFVSHGYKVLGQTFTAQASTYANPFPDPFSGSADSNRTFLLYGTYTATGGGNPWYLYQLRRQ